MNNLRERIYKLLQEYNWEELLLLERKYRDEILKDKTIKYLFDNYFFDAVINYTKTVQDKLYCSIILTKIYKRFIQVKNKGYNIQDDKFEDFVKIYLQILEFNKEKDLAYTIAKKWPHLQEAQDIIQNYENINLTELKHSSKESVKVTINSCITKEDYTISLFKSKQEFEFFNAIRELYPNDFTYPNVAISCILDFNKIQDKLATNERDYFFKSIIDCVVYLPTENNFKPIYFFELDSSYHDTIKQKEKDLIKDNFFSLAGKTLYRIRPKGKQTLCREDFKKLIKEILY